jgi:hypothetical protein
MLHGHTPCVTRPLYGIMIYMSIKRVLISSDFHLSAVSVNALLQNYTPFFSYSLIPGNFSRRSGNYFLLSKVCASMPVISFSDITESCPFKK